MKKSLKKAVLYITTGAMLIGGAFSAKAASRYDGQWCVENNGYWFKLTEDGSTFLANTWYWIKDSDGVIRCYYFDQNGWLVTNQTVGEYTLNEQGQWVVDGKVQTKSDAETEYATHTDLSAGKTAAASSSSAPAAAASSKTKASSKNVVKATSNGDSPANATFTQEYENSAISGGTVSNNWANFKMSFGSTVPTSDKSGTGTDFFIDAENDSCLYVSYFKLDKYAAGNTNIDGFITGFLADPRGFKGGVKASDVTFGDYSFKQLTKAKATPYGNVFDQAYIRQVEGTNYAMVIVVEKNGFDEDYSSALNTMKRIR